jgi:hypothetical protein
MLLEPGEKMLAERDEVVIVSESPLATGARDRVAEQVSLQRIEGWGHRLGQHEAVELLEEAAGSVDALEYSEEVSVLLVREHEVQRDNAKCVRALMEPADDLGGVEVRLSSGCLHARGELVECAGPFGPGRLHAPHVLVEAIQADQFLQRGGLATKRTSVDRLTLLRG